MSNRNIVFVISAPSGSGKTTLCGHLLRANMGLRRAVSYTTRLPRKGERDGRDYFFLKKDEFLKMRKKNEFLEWTQIFGNFYGTARHEFERISRSGRDVVLTLDVRGAMQIRRSFESAVLIFILSPSMKELRERLIQRRGDSPVEVERRLKNARSELKALKDYDYCIVNDDIKKAVSGLKSIVIAERCRVK